MEAPAAVTAAATLVAALAFGAAAHTTSRAPGGMTRSRSIPLFFAIVACFLLVAALRQFAAPFSLTWDRRLILASSIPAAYTILPLAYLAGRILGWRPMHRRLAVMAFAAAGTIGWVFVYIGGVAGPTTSMWGSEWSINSILARAMVLLVLTLPGLGFGALLLFGSTRLEGDDGRRIRLVAAACLVYYGAFTFDAFAAPGPALALERLLTAGAAILALRAYRPPETDRTARLQAQARRLDELI